MQALANGGAAFFVSRAANALGMSDGFFCTNLKQTVDLNRRFNCGRTLSCISSASEIVPLQSGPYLPLALSKLKHLGHSLIESVCRAGSALRSGRAAKSIICDKRQEPPKSRFTLPLRKINQRLMI